MAADARPAVLYLRAFRQESEPFAWGRTKELSRVADLQRFATTFADLTDAEVMVRAWR